jgi:peroxiredoxin
MESNGTNIGQWADERLASLRSDGEWQPDTARGLSLLKARRTATALRAKRRAWTAAAIVAVCAGVVAFPVTRAFAQRCVDACATVLSIRSSPAPHLSAQGFRAGSERKQAPDFTLSDASGRAVKLSDFRGQVVLLNFWATWCVPCRTEVPWFVEFQQNYRDRGFAVLGVSFDDDGWKAVKPYIEAKRINYPVMLGSDDVSGAYGGIASLPTTLLIDKEGRIAVTHLGLCGKNDYLAEIKTLLEERLK